MDCKSFEWYEFKDKVNFATYLINKFGKNGIEIIKVVKLVFLADVYALRNYSMLVSDDKYVAMNNGPVGSEIYDILTKNIEWLEDEKIVYIQKFLKSDWKNTFSRIFSKQNADENHLSIMGKEVLDKIFVDWKQNAKCCFRI